MKKLENFKLKNEFDISPEGREQQVNIPNRAYGEFP